MKRRISLRNVLVFITGSMLCAVLILAFFTFLGNVAIAQSQSQSTQQLQQLSQTFRDVAKAVNPAVVYISTVQTVKGVQGQIPDLFGDEFFRRFFGIPEQREFKQRALGSGFIVSEDGYILTNNHVVQNAEKIQVTLPDKREFDAKVIGTDPKSDMAVIKSGWSTADVAGQDRRTTRGRQAGSEASAPAASALFGLHVQELTPDIASQLGYTLCGRECRIEILRKGAMHLWVRGAQPEAQ